MSWLGLMAHGRHHDTPHDTPHDTHGSNVQTFARSDQSLARHLTSHSDQLLLLQPVSSCCCQEGSGFTLMFYQG